ncbi:uncharacterized protein LOC117648026 isoform X2 [Thrips palmi]|uniref:Uncharacterized protein LOC117648026 isoform X2 n=1 Tax=Thrips palmi TaxID=161013 RepID=A0A6P8Z0R0_THRPL|nr:uncharacterized protein LOC117648026 isoform X2 [Thrips palmi]
MELSNLGDDELLLILGYLSARELLKCRVVCRRWRDAALHPHLWRMKSVDSYNTLLASAVLRLAPCLDSLTAGSLWNFIFDKSGLLLASTKCAISKLHMTFSMSDACYMALVITRQASLGRLKEVSLELFKGKADLPLYRLRAFLQQLLHTPGAAQFEDPVPASLRQLWITVPFPDPYAHLRLKWHATTLEVLKLARALPPAASLPSTMPRLRELDCPLLGGMAVMAQYEALRSLSLEVKLDESTVPYLLGVESFLRAAATRLEFVQLSYEAHEERAAAVDLVLSLGGTGKATAALETLLFSFDADIPTPPLQLRPLTAILHRLSLLRTLNIGGVPSNAFLTALDGEVLPHLRKLSMKTPEDSCPHVVAHSEPIKKLLQSYPLLHIRISDEGDYFDCEDFCDFCAGNKCHRIPDYSASVVFSHPLEDSCEVIHDLNSCYEIHLSLSEVEVDAL